MPSDFRADLRRAIIEALPTRGLEEQEAFASLDIVEQTWRFLNWQSRLVHPHPRQIFHAAGFRTSTAFQLHREEVTSLLAKLAAGVDVGPHLSKGTREGYCFHRNNKKHGPDFDLLLNEWAIHHLHLSSEPRGGGFNTRSDHLLFVIVLPGEAYAVAVGTHDDWTALRLVEEVVRSWPEKRFFISLGVEPGQAFTPQEHLELRKAGLNTVAQVEKVSHVCRITFGLTTALVSIAVSREAARVLRMIDNMSIDPSNVLLQMQEEAARAVLQWPRQPRLRIVRGSAPQQWVFGILEELSGTRLII